MSTETRSVSCRILTPAGFLEGTFHLPQKHNLVDHLNRGDPILRLTDVHLPDTPGVVKFFALQRTSAILVLPLTPGEQPPALPTGTVKPHHTSWMLPGGTTVQGDLQLLQGVRVSDHLLHRTGFVVLRNAVARAWRADGTTLEQPLSPWVALQATTAIGASEVEDAP